MKTLNISLVILLIGSSFLAKEIQEDVVNGYHKEYRKIEQLYEKKQNLMPYQQLRLIKVASNHN